MSVNDLLVEALLFPPSSRASRVEKLVESIAAEIDPAVKKLIWPKYSYEEIKPSRLRLKNFVSEIEPSILAIRRNPLAWRVVEADVRRYLVHRFPFGIYYTCERIFITIWPSCISVAIRDFGSFGFKSRSHVSLAQPACKAGEG